LFNKSFKISIDEDDVVVQSTDEKDDNSKVEVDDSESSHEIVLKKKENFDINNKYYKNYFFKSDQQNVIYLIAIIDYLQLYNAKKYLETVFKSIFVAPTNSGEISSVSPDKYYERFVNYINHITNRNDNIIQLEEENINSRD